MSGRHGVLSWVVVIACAMITGGMGAAWENVFVGLLGVINGVAVGYYYMEFSLRLSTGSRLRRILIRTVYGTAAGAVSGSLVHLPAIFLGKPQEALAFTVLGAMFGAVIGTAFGLLLSCIMAFTSEKEDPAAPAARAAADQEDAGQEEFLQDDVPLVKAVYSALKEHQLFDQYTAQTYRDKTGLATGPEIEARYGQARAWLQAARPGFTDLDWDRGNAAAHKLVRLLVSAQGKDDGGLASRCPGLGEEVTAWLRKSAGLFL